tara:strand:+ start:218 stop:814 length:597 start_codon:yes stop_codon:yes gene_type:complete
MKNDKLKHIKLWESFISEDRQTEFDNVNNISNDIISKSNEMLNSNPIKIYNRVVLPSDYPTNDKLHKHLINNPDTVSVIKIKPVTDVYQGIDLKDKDVSIEVIFGRTMYQMNGDEYTGKENITISLNGIKNGLLNNSLNSEESITNDGFQSIITIMKSVIDISTAFNESEKKELLQIVITDIKKYISKELENLLDEIK